MVSELEGCMKSMITETDLRRALGLAFQEFEGRLQETFAESNQRFLQMFSKKEDVIEVQSLMSKKVNWTEHNTVHKKLSELRAYIDDTAKSVFVGHLDALDQQFGQKADATMVDLALKSKADFADMTDVRARLERLEVLFAHSDAQNRERLEELRDDLTQKRDKMMAHVQAQLDAHTETMSELREELACHSRRISSTEGSTRELTQAAGRLTEGQALVEERQESTERALGELQESCGEVRAAQERSEANQQALTANLSSLADSVNADNDASAKKFAVHSEQIEFLMQATEMLKRRLRETSKAHKDSCQELTEQHEGLVEKLSALERSLKQQERDMKSLAGEPPVGKALTQKALGPLPTPDAHLRSVLEQLEQIAIEPVNDSTFDPKRPPLSIGITGADFAQKDALAPLSARLPGLVGTCSQSPRVVSGSKSARKREKTLR